MMTLRCTCFDAEKRSQMIESINMARLDHLPGCPCSKRAPGASAERKRSSGCLLSGEPVLCKCGDAAHEHRPYCTLCDCTAWRPMLTVLERLSLLEAKLQEVTGRAAESDIELVRTSLAKLWVSENGPAVRAAFERLVARQSEPE